MSIIEFIQGFSAAAAIFLFLGLVLLTVEMFIPGFGIFGFSGLACLVIAIIIRANTFAEGLWMTVVLLAIVGVLLLIFLRSASNGAINRSNLVLKDELSKESGFLSSEDLDYFIGRAGVALTVMRPSGMADFDGVKLDVVSEGEFIEAKVPVKVVRVDARRIVVRPLDEQELLAKQNEARERKNGAEGL